MTRHYRTRPDLCPAAGHPGVTYNPNFGPEGQTWCLCGKVTYPGMGGLTFTELIRNQDALKSPLGRCDTCAAVEGERHRPTCPEYVSDDALTLFGRSS